MDYGIYIIAVIVIIFYLRLYLIRRGKKRRENLEILDRVRQGKRAKPLPARDPNVPTIVVKNWWILGAGFLLMLLGLAMNYQGFLPDYKSYWWIPMAVGGLLFIFDIE